MTTTLDVAVAAVGAPPDGAAPDGAAADLRPLVPAVLAASQPPFRLRAEMSRVGEAPGKAWFFELAAAVIDADRCVQCGACIAACPSDSLAVGAGDIPELVKLCTGCGLCWDFCPRAGLRYETTWLERPGDAAPDRLAARARPGAGEGRAPRAQDGGVVSAVLLAALEAGEIDAAVVAREDPSLPFKGVPLVATTAEQIMQSAGSFYNQTMALAALDLAAAGLAPDARVALVGTPCEIQGLRALQAHSWRRGASRVDAVVLTIALLCTKSFDYESLMVNELGLRRGVEPASVSKVDIVHGRLVVEDRSGAVVVDEPVRDFHGAALKGCDECADFLGRSADLSVGSVGSATGWSSVVVRTPAGAAALARAGTRLETAGLSRPEALDKLDELDRRIAERSLRRPLDPAGRRFIGLGEHLEAYDGSDRQPVWIGR